MCLATDANGGTLSYVGQLNSDVNLELQAAGKAHICCDRGCILHQTGFSLCQRDLLGCFLY